MPPVPQVEWVQYGSFGLIAFLVIVGLPGSVFALWRMINAAFEYHTRIIKQLTDAFTAETRECRVERQTLSDRSEERAERERISRQELAQSIQRLSIAAELAANRGQHS
jgi:hypothetical protein